MYALLCGFQFHLLDSSVQPKSSLSSSSCLTRKHRKVPSSTSSSLVKGMTKFPRHTVQNIQMLSLFLSGFSRTQIAYLPQTWPTSIKQIHFRFSTCSNINANIRSCCTIGRVFKLSTSSGNNSNNNNSNNNNGFRFHGGNGRGRDDDDEENDDHYPNSFSSSFALSQLFIIARASHSRGKVDRPSKPSRKSLVTYILLALNILGFLFQKITHDDLTFAGAKINALILRGQWYRLVTPIFLHGGILHLIVNCVSLWRLGPTVEQWFGQKRTVVLYLVAGIAGNILSFYFCPSPSLGASGAVFGYLGALLMLCLRNKELFGEAGSSFIRSLGFTAFYNFLFGLQPGSSIDNFGHLGGLIGGLFFTYLFGPRISIKRDRYGRPIELIDQPLVPTMIKRTLGKSSK